MALRKSLLWIPLSLPIFCVDIVQRGFAAFATMIPNIKEALSVYFLTMSVSVLFFGFICDKFNARKIILLSMIAAAIGMIILPYSSLGFGLIFGSAAALIKIAPFSAPLKLINKNEAVVISPQAAAKNLAGALFILFLGTMLQGIGWATTTFSLGIFIILCGVFAYFSTPDDKVEGWKWSIFLDLVKQWKFWFAAVYFFLMSGWYYMAVKAFIPAMIKSDFTKNEAMTIMAFSFLASGVLRFVVAWAGSQTVFGIKTRLPLMWLGTFGEGVCVAYPFAWITGLSGFHIPFTETYPLIALSVFTVLSSIHTPNYWAYCKEEWGSTYVATVVSLGFFFMYLGTGIMYGSWSA